MLANSADSEILMIDPRQVEKDMLVGLVELHIAERGLDYAHAREFAQRQARASLVSPMLLAWFEAKTWTHSPPLC